MNKLEAESSHSKTGSWFDVLTRRCSCDANWHMRVATQFTANCGFLCHARHQAEINHGVHKLGSASKVMQCLT